MYLSPCWSAPGVAPAGSRLFSRCRQLPAQPYDLVFSRFGVMFFDDPVAAFQSTQQSAPADAVFCVLAAPGKNPWMSVPARGSLFTRTRQPAGPQAPGPFAFAEGDYVTNILKTAASKISNFALKARSTSAMTPTKPFNCKPRRPCRKLMAELDGETRTQALAAGESLAEHQAITVRTGPPYGLSAPQRHRLVYG